jgi:ribosomal protein S18 acetylase RimI-like enzyme
MEVRLAAEKDTAHLVAAYMTHVNPSRREAERFARLHQGLDRALLAEEGGIVLAGLTWATAKDPRQGLAEITGVLVNERARRRGLATLLTLLALEDMATVHRMRGGSLRRVVVHADQSDLAARRLWEKMGFAAQALLKDHRAAGKVDVIYALHPS